MRISPRPASLTGYADRLSRTVHRVESSSWIGGGANQAAMKEVFEVGDELFSAMVAVDVLVASVWMAVLLFMAGESQRIDRRRGADTSALDDLKRRATEFQERHARIAAVR